MRQRRDEVDDGKTADRTQEQAAPHALRQCGERNGGDQRPHRIGGDELPRQAFRHLQIARDRRKHARRHDLGQQRDESGHRQRQQAPSGNRSLLPAGADIVV